MSTQEGLHTERPERLLVITAHPDDADFGVAGSVARWVREGTVAHLVCCTSGDAGSDDAGRRPARAGPPPRGRAARRGTRSSATRASPSCIGRTAPWPTTWRCASSSCASSAPSGRMPWPRPTRASSSTRTASSSTSTIATAGAAAVDAVYPAARNAMAFPHLVTAEGLAPHAVARLYLFWPERPGAYVDISDTLDVKLAALHAHASQHREPEQLDEPHPGLGGAASRRAAAEASRRRRRPSRVIDLASVPRPVSPRRGSPAGASWRRAEQDGRTRPQASQSGASLAARDLQQAARAGPWPGRARTRPGRTGHRRRWTRGSAPQLLGAGKARARRRVSRPA